MPSRIIGLPGVEQFEASTWEKMLEIQEFMRMANHGFDWVWWDCASVAQDALLDDIWSGTVAEKPARAFLIDPDTGKPGKPNTTPTSGLDKGEYGRNMERIGQWVRHMVGANSFHFGITFHPFEGPHPTNDEGDILLQPWVQGKGMVSKLCGYMNMVMFMEVKENTEKELKWRRFHMTENERFYAKDQYDAFLPKGYADNLTVPKLMAAVEKARGNPLGNGKTTLSKSPARRGGS